MDIDVGELVEVTDPESRDHGQTGQVIACRARLLKGNRKEMWVRVRLDRGRGKPWMRKGAVKLLDDVIAHG